MNPQDLLLYVITDHTWLGDTDLADAVAAAIAGGATIVQLREKNIDDETYIARAREIKAVCDRFGVPLVINDRLSVALATGAGVHLGASDGEISKARQVLGAEAIVGATVKTVQAAKAAEAAGASYLGAGAVFGSTTKTDATPMPHPLFSEICAAVSIPVVAIGGVTAENAPQLKGLGMAGLCVISAVFAQPDVQKAAAALQKIAKEVCI